MSSTTAESVTLHPYWTVDLVAQIPHVEGKRYEIIDGELFVTSRPHARHQITTAAICFQLHTWGQTTDAGYAFEAPGIVYDAQDAISPDVVWVSKARMASIIASDGKLHESPELVVEVLSRSTAAVDRKEKLALYERHDVQEYWIVDWRAETIDVYRRSDKGLVVAQILRSGETLTFPLLPGFACSIERLCTIRDR